MTSTLDPRAGTHFTGKIFVTPHALDRAVEYFGVDRGKAPMHVMDLLRKASLIDANSLSDDGTVFRLYAYKRIVFAVAPHEDKVITLYPRDDSPIAVREGVAKVLSTLLRAAQRKETREVKRLELRRAELTVERAECALRKLKTTSINVAKQMDGRIAEIDGEVAAINAEIFEVRREKTTLAKGIAAYV
jgi:hypothetical protein